ncbi:hypothetical protein [Dickeya dadantii]|uniref:Uncharacterized protein n=1 Tax=Dickeya dadantii (strain 3937) TaxID=198628 RepID=E0SI13_DICD3|nr:hypothetical protein [Dickeya dadantii]ADN00222.1 hypothetical protein Dda3937_02161 [Dickeya dadantii 3937]NPE52366.1 hypothetical protein [Dickeya dadantii]
MNNGAGATARKNRQDYRVFIRPAIGRSDAQTIIESLAQGISDYLDISNEISLFKGLKESIKQAVSTVMTPAYSAKPYRHDKKKKFN